jgi:hypothetical protein
MTTPNQTSPDGAIVVGGGQWLYGQTVNEATARAAFELPMPTPDNMLDLLRIVLESLPLEALQPFADFLGVVDGVFTTAGEAVEGILSSLDPRVLLQTVDDFNDWLAETFGPLNNLLNQLIAVLGGASVTPINTAIGDVVEWISGLNAFDIDAWNAWLTTTFNPLKTKFEKILTLLSGGTVDALGDATIQAIIDFLSDLGSGSAVELTAAVVTAISDAIKDLVKRITGGLTGAWSELDAWLETIPVIGDIVEAITGAFGTLADLVLWIKNNVLSLPAGRLVGQITDNVLGLVNIGHLTTQPVNLLASPGFESLSTISPVDGWSWDSSQNATGSGGSAKVVCDGYNKELSHKTAIRVAAGDIMQLSAAVKTASVTGTGWKASISVMEYRDGAIATPVEIASRTSNTSAWVTISGGYTVPANVSSVVFRLTVTDALSGTVWFDDLDIHKSGAIVQDWVENLNTTWENIYTGTFGTSGAGKKWFDVGPAIATMTSNTSLAKQAGDNAQGNVQTTWNALVDGFDKTTGSLGKTPTDVRTRGQAVREQADLGVVNAASAAGAASTAQTAASNASTAASNASTAASNAATAASTADGKAVSVATGLRQTVGGEPGTTGVPASTGTYLTNLISKMYGTGVSTPQTFITNNAISGLPTTRLSGTISQGQITDGAVSTAKLASTVVSDITSSVRSSTVGSGLTINRTNSAAAYSTLSGQRRIASGFYNATGRTSTDVTVSTSSGFYAINITNPGWYMIDMGFLLTGQNYHSYNWWFRPLFFKGADTGNFYKCGTEVININYSRTPANSKGPSCAQASWIEYLTSGDTIWPGYLWSNQDSVSSDSIITSAASQFGTYFSISLLNRSLA